MTFDLTHCKKDFPLFEKHPSLVYLDSAATTHKPQAVIDAITTFYSEHYGTVHRSIYRLSREATRLYQEARKKVAHFLHAQNEDQIVFTKGTTASLNLVAKSFGKTILKPEDVVLVSEIEHHSNLVPWQMICQETGAKLKAIPVNDRGEICLDSYSQLLKCPVKIVSIPHVSNVIGTVHPIQDIIRMAHATGAVVCIDGAQSAGHFSINVTELDADFFAFSGHKLYGPTGIGILYGKKEWLAQMSPLEGGGDMIEEVSLEKTLYLPPPLRFEAGTPLIAEAIGLSAALDYITSIGQEKIHAWESFLVREAKKSFLKISGLRILGDPAHTGSLLSFAVEGVHSLDLGTLLDCKNIAIRTGHLCSQPAMKRFGISTTARISFGIYNQAEDIERCAQAIQGISNQLT
jgi:cysteine desulfurase/selenocysteine lyase